MASGAGCLAGSQRAPVTTGFMALLAAMTALAFSALHIVLPALPILTAAFERWLDPANFDAEGRQRQSLASFQPPAA